MPDITLCSKISCDENCYRNMNLWRSLGYFQSFANFETTEYCMKCSGYKAMPFPYQKETKKE